MSPNGVFRRPSPAEQHYLPHSHPRHSHGLHVAQEFELAQARCAQQFNLAIPPNQLPERKLKKQKISAASSEATTPKQSAHLRSQMSVDEHLQLGDAAHLRGFYSIAS